MSKAFFIQTKKSKKNTGVVYFGLSGTSVWHSA